MTSGKNRRKRQVYYPVGRIASFTWSSGDAVWLRAILKSTSISYRSLAKAVEDLGVPCNHNTIRDLVHRRIESIEAAKLDAICKALDIKPVEALDGIEIDSPVDTEATTPTEPQKGED